MPPTDSVPQAVPQQADRQADRQADDAKPKRRRGGKGSASTPPPMPAATPMAGFDFEGLNRRYMQRAGSAALNGAESYGPRIETLDPPAGQTYWKVIGIYHLSPDENRDRHNAFIEALDENGRRVKDGLLAGSIWEGKSDGPDRPKPLDKPDSEPAADVPIEKDMTLTIWLEGGGPSERVANIHTRHEDEFGPGGGKSSRFHHSYYIVFQRTQAGAAGGQQGSGTGATTGDATNGPTNGTGGQPGVSTGGSSGTPGGQPFRFLRWPTDHLQIIQPFGANPEIYAQFGFAGHEGVDIVVAESDPIYCVAPGTVTMINTPDAYALNGHAYGIHVRVAHQDGYETIYAHFKTALVGVGDAVTAGQVLGLADHTGNVWGDPPDHLHLTLKHAGETAPGYRSNIIDPMPFLLPLLNGGTTPDVAAPVSPNTSQMRVAQKLGLNCNAPVDGSGAITPRLADPRLIGETGVEWVRLNLIVRAFSGPDDPAWIATYRRMIDGLRGQGLHIYALIGAEAVDDPGDQFRDPPPPGAVENDWVRRYAANFRRIVKLFGKDLAVVESFNEPNDWHHTDGIEWKRAWIHPGWFAIILQAVYDALQDLPPVTLVSGPLLSTPDGNDAAAYLPEVYEAGVERFGWGQGAPVPFDGVGFHPYVLGDSGNPQVEVAQRYRQYIAEVRNAIARFEPLGKPLYLSELGFQNAPERQAACMEVGLTCALDDPAVALCFWYGMQDDGAEFYGLYRQDGLTPGHRKLVYDRFVALAANGRSVPSARTWEKQPGAMWVADLDSTLDDSVLAPGNGFTKVWRVRNTGATTWDEGYRLLHVDGPTLGERTSVPAVPACAPGQTADIQVSFAAPGAEGQYTSIWQLADAQGNRFGQILFTRFQVAAPAAVSLEGALAPLGLEAMLPNGAALSPLAAAALGIIHQTYWLRVSAAAGGPDAQQALQAAGDDALNRILELMRAQQ